MKARKFRLNLAVLSGVAIACLPQAVSAQIVSTGPASETPFPPQAVQFLRGLTLMLLPHTYSDDDDWGGEKRIQSGLNVDLDGLKVRTSRRWKNVNHGTWRRADAQLVDPKTHFQLNIAMLPHKEEGVPRYRVNATMRLRVVGRQQQWSVGAKLYSISADATADVAINAEVAFRSDLVKNAESTKLQILPHIEAASLRLTGYRLNGISHAKGNAIRELGRTIKPIVERAVRKKGEKLPGKINSKIMKKPERFQIPASILAFLKKKEAAVKTNEVPTAEPK